NLTFKKNIMAKTEMLGKISFINHEKKYAMIEYEAGGKKRTVRGSIDIKLQKDLKDKKLIKKAHHFMIGDMVSFNLKTVDKDGKMVANNIEYLYNNALDMIINKATTDNNLKGYLKIADDKYFIRQKPNYWNSLGVVKFELTNSMSIYLHDTNQRDLFTDPMRLVSSGCIRLEKPLDLAEYLLQGTQWTRSAIENFVAKPGQVMTTDTKISLSSPMPVYTIFLTSQLTSDNVLRFTTDVYQQNGEILGKMRAAF
ncbi:MAG: hypothetical protein EOP04_28960, partial [Proteobacteria bacterium]